MQLARIIIFVLMLPATLIAQEKTDTIVEHEELDPVKLNFIFSYYEQDGVHSPVTGGIGDEELHDGKQAEHVYHRYSRHPYEHEGQQESSRFFAQDYSHNCSSGRRESSRLQA